MLSRLSISCSSSSITSLPVRLACRPLKKSSLVRLAIVSLWLATHTCAAACLSLSVSLSIPGSLYSTMGSPTGRDSSLSLIGSFTGKVLSRLFTH